LQKMQIASFHKLTFVIDIPDMAAYNADIPLE
jgi:hypothetical protein